MTGASVDADIQVSQGSFMLEVALTADPGEVVAVMGPSGAGKSTLFGAIAGFAPLSAGRVRLDGRTVEAPSGAHVPPRERSVALLGQNPLLFPHLSARENVAFGPRARRVPRHRARADADAWLDRVGLAGLGDRRPAQLSGGQQQRVALARALATSPKLLLLDEPLTSLDPATAEGIRVLLREQLTATGTTTLIATHDPADAASLACHLVVIEGGRVTQAGSVPDVLAAPATPFVAALAAVRPEATPPAWQARVETVESDGSHVRVRARTLDGTEVVVRLPAGVAATPGATISIRPPSR